MGLTSHFPLNQDYGRKHSSMEDVSPFLLLPTKVALLLWRWNSLPISEAMEREKMERQRDLFGDTKWQVNPPPSRWSRCRPHKNPWESLGVHVRKSLASSKSWPEWTQSNNGAQLAGQVCTLLPSKAGSSKEMQASADMSSRMSSSRSFKMDACLNKGVCFFWKNGGSLRSQPGAMVVLESTLHHIET